MDRTEGPEGPRQEGNQKAKEVGRTAQEGARQSAHVVREKGQEVAGTAREGAQEVLQETAGRGRDLYERFKEQAEGEAGTQARRLATNIRYLAEDLQHMSESCKPESPAAPLVRRMAERGHTLADRLDRQRPGELLDEVRDFARRRPGMFLAGAALAGFAVSRLGRGVTAAGGTSTDMGTDTGTDTGTDMVTTTTPGTDTTVLPAPEEQVEAAPVPPSAYESQAPRSAYTPEPGLHGGEGPPPSTTPRVTPPARPGEPGKPGRGW
ncbi:hypothetical protein [Streptomyces poonensis]|uniref:Uncharacterized protein n=1 Tax=Streptomyces poonensis TaxID=68255 RepID=A0A918Q4D5_9ACTN|nr:hypothetical protein [Streptomyces poonensis]GGZ32792.1 hypothetical protein GCM10010365_62140 [Streptomyces poonensis]GLJ93157.1 hypothetical protein GCM10017589_57690 [Streptomyces poonensis]